PSASSAPSPGVSNPAPTARRRTSSRSVTGSGGSRWATTPRPTWWPERSRRRWPAPAWRPGSRSSGRIRSASSSRPGPPRPEPGVNGPSPALRQVLFAENGDAPCPEQGGGDALSFGEPAVDPDLAAATRGAALLEHRELRAEGSRCCRGRLCPLPEGAGPLVSTFDRVG